MSNTNLYDFHIAVCPADWTHISSVNGCYKWVDRKWSWNNAALTCRVLNKDAHLVVINNAAEQAAIAQMLDSIDGRSYYVFCRVYHIVAR